MKTVLKMCLLETQISELQDAYKKEPSSEIVNEINKLMRELFELGGALETQKK